MMKKTTMKKTMTMSSHGAGPDEPERGRNVVICCDGTGIAEENSTGQSVTPSNVKKIYMCVDTDPDDVEVADNDKNDEQEEKKETQENGTQEQPRPQIAYYERGVASIGGAFAKASAGLTGSGIDQKIIIMYHWLGTNWQEYSNGEEDRLFLFGFSRGAFAVRSLMGMISHVGLLDLRGLTSEEAYRRANIAFKKGYKKRIDGELWAKGTGKMMEKNPQPWAFFGGKDRSVPVHFVGVWDTVGQLGLPRETWCLWCLGFLCAFTPNRYGFHDVRMNQTVRTARHAVAIDEMRSTFQPVYDRSNFNHPGSDVKQVWFPGCHGNVGGGLVDTGLSDIALKWMVDEAGEKGLRFHRKMLDQIKPNPRGDIFYTHGVSIYKNLTHYPRSMPPVIPEKVEGFDPTDHDVIHESALERSHNPPITDAPYFPHKKLLNPGDMATVLIRADKIYNPTNVYLEPGSKWKFTACGRWAGFNDRMCGPEGYPRSFFRKPIPVSTAVLIGRCQRALRMISRNREANLPFVRRHDFFPWYSLMGMVASGATRDSTARAELHQIVGIMNYAEFNVGEKGGYLYCYCNDAWGYYLKNKGTMELTIERIE